MLSASLGTVAQRLAILRLSFKESGVPGLDISTTQIESSRHRSQTQWEFPSLRRKLRS